MGTEDKQEEGVEEVKVETNEPLQLPLEWEQQKGDESFDFI